MIVLRTPKGWTGPKEVDGVPVEGTWRAHQVPLSAARDDAGPPRRAGGRGCAPTGPRSSSTPTAPRSTVVDWLPAGELRMGANPHANGGRLTRPLELPDFRAYAVKVPSPARRRPSRPGCWAAGCAT